MKPSDRVLEIVPDYSYRLIKSQDCTYILTPDEMLMLTFNEYPAPVANGGKYTCLRYNNYTGQRLSRSSVKKMFKDRNKTGRCGRTRWFWKIEGEPATLQIGCQKFDATAVYAIQKWLAR